MVRTFWLNSYWGARLKEVRRLIVERDSETMMVIQSIKMLAAHKHLIAPPLFLNRDSDHGPSSKKVDGETAGRG